MSNDVNDKEPESDEPRTGWFEQLGIPVRQKFWSSDKFLSLLAFLISIGTFSTFAYQTYLIQKQQYANVLPYLMITYDHGGDYFQVDVTNSGVGPAFVQDLTIHYQDSSYRMNLRPFAYQMIQPDSSSAYNVSSSALPQGYAIPSKESVLLIGSNNRETADLLKGIFFKDDTEIEIVYSSVYDEQWRITTGSFVPEKID